MARGAVDGRDVIRSVPPTPIRGMRAVAATADGLATQAAMWTFARGGNAVDAALAANAAMAVVAPHVCGMGGDLFAVVRTPDGELIGLDASGRAGSAAPTPSALRAEGHRTMPLRHDVRTVTVPGCVDGWMLLHERFASLPFGEIAAPAIGLAAAGFPASPLLCASLDLLDDAAGAANFVELAVQARTPGAPVRRPGVALTLQGIVRGGRDAFYGGAFGEGLLELGGGVFGASPTSTPCRRRGCPCSPTACSATSCTRSDLRRRATSPSPSPACWSAPAFPVRPRTPSWAHLFIEAVQARLVRPPGRAARGRRRRSAARTGARSCRRPRRRAGIGTARTERARRHDVPVHGR